MNLRTKLLLPFLAIAGIFVAIVHYYWVPAMVADARQNYISHEKSIILALEADLIRNLLAGDLAALHASLDKQMARQESDWRQLAVYDSTGQRIYPLRQPDPIEKEHTYFYEHPINWHGEVIATIALNLNVNPAVEQYWKQFRQIEWLGLMLFCLLLGAVMVWQNLFVVKPISNLVVAATRLSNGDFGHSLTASGRDEISSLTHAFETMRLNLTRVYSELEERVRVRTSALQERKTELQQEIAARIQIEQELLLAKDQAEAASLAKSRFLSTMSHELRTPLNAIIGYSDLLHEEAEATGRQEMLPDLVRINLAGQQLLELINSILDLSKIEAGKMELQIETFETADLIEEVKVSILPLLEKNGNRLDLDYAEASGTMVTDHAKLRQILINLLSNAGKFTNNGRVELEVHRQCDSTGDWLQFRVRDSGIGIKAEQLGLIFESFSQVDDSFGRHYEGTGLGLAICKHLCELMGGTIEAESEMGKGSTFTVRIPAVAEQRYPDSAGGESNYRRSIASRTL